ncbi:MAG: hypothetical protein E2P04_06670 [Acidobacteria bacterium]|nr:MAG: hypothetical protein E2P04_06670 [Acidobacteriota bacterium]
MKKAILLTATVLFCTLFVSADLAHAQSCGHIQACTGRAGAVPDGTGVGVPLTVAHSAIPGELDLSWGASCVSSDSD